ncbi:MAG: DUF4330 family protein [Ruminococcus sp.]|nr:DUF4330 family protein [Candidatus Apopatosoma intestinale]
MKTTKKAKLNLFDVILIVAVAAIVTALLLKVTYFNKSEAAENRVTVEFTVYDIMNVTATAAKSGNVYLRDDTVVGTVNGASILQSRVYLTGDDGKIERYATPLEKKDLVGKMTLSGIMKNTGFYVGGKQRITVGATLPVYIFNPATGNGASVEITVDSITPIS